MEGNDSSLIACMYMHIHACIPIACTCGALLPINDEIRDSCSFKLVASWNQKQWRELSLLPLCSSCLSARVWLTIIHAIFDALQFAIFPSSCASWGAV